MSFNYFGCCPPGYHQPDLSQLIKECIEALKEWDGTKKWLENWLENLDITQDVAEQLQKMVDDGTLGELINQELLANISEITDGIKMTRQSIQVVQNPSCALLLECARSYVLNSNKFTYGGPSFLTTIKKDSGVEQLDPVPLTVVGGEAKNRVSCSSLVLACLNGIDYNHSRAYNGRVTQTEEGNYVLTGGKNYPASGANIIDTYNANVLKYAEEGEVFIYASSIAHMLNDRGYLHNIDPNMLYKLQPGDILFYADPTLGAGKWAQIHHCEIFAGFQDEGYMVYAVSNAEENPIRLFKRLYTDTYPAQQLAYFGRVPLTGNPLTGVDIVANAFTGRTVSPDRPIITKLNNGKSFANQRAYIATIRYSSFSGSDFKFVVGACNGNANLVGSTAFSPTDRNHYIGVNCYYATFHIDSGTPQYFYVGCSGEESTADIIDAALLEYPGYPVIV